MEIKNKKMMFALILVVLALVSAFVVEAQLGFRFRQSNIRMYFNGKMLVNYIIIFSILFIIVYFLGFKEKNRPKGVLTGFLIAALFALSVALTIFITKGEPNFIWEISKLKNVSWLFKFKTIINALIVASICLVVYNFKFKEKAAEKGGKLAAAFVIIIISILVASMINYSAAKPDKLPEGVEYDSNTKYVDRWIWQYTEVSKIKLFLLGDPEKEEELGLDSGQYKNPETKETKQAILKIGPLGAGLPAFFLGSILLIWLFIHFEIFKGSKTFQYSVPILLAALLANEPSMTKEVVMGYAFWTALLIIRHTFTKTGKWGEKKPGLAFGLAFAIVQTVYVAIVGEAYFIGSKKFLTNFVYGLVGGFIWDLLLGKGGVWEASTEKWKANKEKWSEWIASRPAEALAALGRGISSLSPTRFARLARWLTSLRPLESDLAVRQREAARILRALIILEARRPRKPAVNNAIRRLRRRFADIMREIRNIQRRIARLRGGP